MKPILPNLEVVARTAAEFHDLDPMNVVWHGNHVRFLEVGRRALLNRIGYGYEAMKLGLSTIASLGNSGDSKSAVLSALFATAGRRSVLGTYSVDRDGDTTLRSIGLYKVGPTGDPAFWRTITPARVL